MQSSNKMESMPIPKLLISMAIPLMFSLLVQSLYNIVDSMYVARLSEKALSATSLAYPVQILMIALGVGTAVGENALLSRLLGQKKQEEAGKCAVTGLILAVISSVLFILFGVIFSDKLAAAMTGDSEIAGMCAEYLWIVTVFSTGCLVEMMAQRFLQATGKTWLSMVSLVVGAVLNIILDPIMIFGLLGCPAMGIRGAAIATVIGQWTGAVTALLLNRHLNPEVRLIFKGFRMEKEMVAGIYKVGFPTIIMQAMGSVMTFGINAILSGGTEIAFFGAYFKLQNFLFMPMNGLGQACLPIIGYNYGAGQKDRISETIKTSLKWGIIVGLAGTILFMAIPGPLLGLFKAGEEMLAIGVPAIRIICVTYAFTAVTTVLGLCASGLGNGVINMLGTGIRQVFLLLPCFYLMRRLWGLPIGWCAMWIAEIAAALIVIILFRKEIQEKTG